MKKNVLIVISGIKVGGGSMSSATLIGNELSKKGYNVNYLTFYNATNKYHILGKEWCLNFSRKNNIFSRFGDIIRKTYFIKKYCKKYSIDTCISFGEEENLSNIWSSVFLNNTSRNAISIRSSIDINNGRIGKFLLKTFLKRSNYIVTIVKEETQNLIKNYNIDSDKITNIYNMFDLDYINTQSKENLGEYEDLFDNGNFTFINIGRFTIQKNQKILIDAFADFYKSNKNTQLIILGDGPLKYELYEQAKKLNMDNNIHFLGVHKNPYKFLKKSDVYISSSAWEGMSRAILEAMTCGLPIITTDHPTGAKEILNKHIKDFYEVDDISIEEYGILVPNHNMHKLQEAMKTIYSNIDLINNLKLKSVKRSKDFGIDSIIREWENIL